MVADSAVAVSTAGSADAAELQSKQGAPNARGFGPARSYMPAHPQQFS
jgi:hypothetical protein